MSGLRIIRPDDADEALALASVDDPGVSLYAGGVHLAPSLIDGIDGIRTLIDVKHLPEMRVVRLEDGKLCVGAAVTHRGLGHAVGVEDRFPTLASGIFRLGNPRVRATGTVGGNLATRASESDLGMLLTAYGGRVVALTITGEVTYPVERWRDPPHRHGLLLRVEIPTDSPPRERSYQRFPAHGTPVAAAVGIGADPGGSTGLEVLVGCAGGPPTRIAVDDLMDGSGGLDLGGSDELRRRVTAQIEAVDAPTASARFRRHLASVLAERALAAVSPIKGR
jgi:aerobic carbon-monoxide dehydrogenase medium subunit